MSAADRIRAFLPYTPRLFFVAVYVAAFGIALAFFTAAACYTFGPTMTAWMLGLMLLVYVGQTYLPRSGP